MEFRLGIVLSGGGSRGLAHAGVLSALAEEGIVPQAIAGTSAGALVGALDAAGYAAADMLRFFATTAPFRLSRLAALGKPGWLDTAKIEADFRNFFPDDSFSALRKKLFVTATELATGRLEIFSAGPLVRPLLASASIPMVFTPTEVGGRLYADGGIVNNFPVEPLLGLCDVVLGVYASPLASSDAAALDNSLAVSQRALEIGMYFASKRKFHQADLVLSPPELAQFSTFDLKRHDDILEVGYRAARARLAEIHALLAGV